MLTGESSDLGFPLVELHSFDRDEHAVFRDAEMDLTQFVGSWQKGGACNHGFREGGFTIQPKSNQLPDIAMFRFWFKAELESGGDPVAHYIQMEGEFDEPANWPPTTEDTETTVTFNYWFFKAKNKKVQGDDCAGESEIPGGSWTVTVKLVE